MLRKAKIIKKGAVAKAICYNTKTCKIYNDLQKMTQNNRGCSVSLRSLCKLQILL